MLIAITVNLLREHIFNMQTLPDKIWKQKVTLVLEPAMVAWIVRASVINTDVSKRSVVRIRHEIIICSEQKGTNLVVPMEVCFNGQRHKPGWIQLKTQQVQD